MYKKRKIIKKKNEKSKVKFSKRKHKSIMWRIYKIDDNLVSKDNFYKKGRPVIALNNDKKAVKFIKITKLNKEDGSVKPGVTKIEKYPDVHKYVSGARTEIYDKTRWNEPILEEKLTKTKSRINKWDQYKINKALNKKNNK